MEKVPSILGQEKDVWYGKGSAFRLKLFVNLTGLLSQRLSGKKDRQIYMYIFACSSPRRVPVSPWYFFVRWNSSFSFLKKKNQFLEEVLSSSQI